VSARNHLALWAGVTALFAQLATVSIIALLGNESSERNKALAALITGFVVAGGVYSKQKWDDAKAEREGTTLAPTTASRNERES
jgi:uncharacterized membrane protein